MGLLFFFFLCCRFVWPDVVNYTDGCRMFETTIKMLCRLFKEVYAFKIEYSSLIVSPSVLVAYSEYSAARKQRLLIVTLQFPIKRNHRSLFTSATGKLK